MSRNPGCRVQSVDGGAKGQKQKLSDTQGSSKTAAMSELGSRRVCGASLVSPGPKTGRKPRASPLARRGEGGSVEGSEGPEVEVRVEEGKQGNG